MRRALLLGAILLSIWLLVRGVDAHYPIREWLFWRYSAYWAAILIWSLGCLNIGFHLARWLRLTTQRAREVLLYSMALGVLGFFLLMVLLGFCGLYVKATFFLLPLATCLAFPKPLWRYARRGLRHARALGRRERVSLSARLLSTAALLYGAYSILLLYLSIITPEGSSYDARWYHLGIAEHYVAEHGIKPFVEGWFVGAYPHLASFLYTWAFLSPLGDLFDRVELAAHLEFVLFLLTLPGISVLATRLLKGKRFPLAWVALFLYPGIFLYDSSLIIGADHVCAFWACPIYLAFLLTYRSGAARHWVLLAALMGAALLTKYSAVCLVGLPLAVLTARLCYWGLFARRLGRPRPNSVLAGPLLGFVAGLAVTAPHWLKNWVWYDNPVYPYAYQTFHNRPWSPFAEELLHSWASTYEWEPHGTLFQRLRETVLAGFTFSFVPHDWPAFHGAVPVFGFLFTLGLLLLPFVKAPGRLWVATLSTQVGVFLWYWGMHQDRYLQVLVPWMAASSAALLVLAWRNGALVRLGLSALVGLQLVWGADVYLIPAHAMLGRPPILAALDLIGDGFKKRYAERFKIFEPYRSIGLAAPANARILLHENHVRTGLRVPVVSDWVRSQGGIEYGSMGSPRGIYQWTRDLGLTHVVWGDKPSYGMDSIAGDLLFYDFLNRHTHQRKRFGSFNLAKIVDAPEIPEPARVTYFGCANTYDAGLYDVTQMRVPGETNRPKSKYPAPLTRADAANTAVVLLAQSRYLAYDPSCHQPIPAQALSHWKQMTTRGSMQLWVRD